jgi:hypothetical protein
MIDDAAAVSRALLTCAHWEGFGTSKEGSCCITASCTRKTLYMEDMSQASGLRYFSPTTPARNVEPMRKLNR